MVHQFVPADIFRLIEREKVTTCSLVPTMAIALVCCPDREQRDISSLRCVMIGGAASAPTLVRDVEQKLGCACISGYGLTETSPVSPSRQSRRGAVGMRLAITSVPARAMRFPRRDPRVVVPRSGSAQRRRDGGEVVARGDVAPLDLPLEAAG
jgi:acyl-CoA synthetase (AMP-forming)/AMP-acid ligase II